MGKLLDHLKNQPLSIIVSLPRNDPKFAEAALAGGADALKVHLRVHHKASGTQFGPLDQEKPMIQTIVKLAAGRPVGIVPGDLAHPPDQAEVQALADLGIDFIDFYVSESPEWLWKATPLTKMAGIQQPQEIALITPHLAEGASIVEAAIIPKEGYGERLNIGDLQKYLNVSHSTPLPTVVPTQRAIRPEELAPLFDANVKGVIIGAIVTGDTYQSIETATKAFIAARELLTEHVS